MANISKEQQSADEQVLAFDPFEGDFGMPGDTVFSNKMVLARKVGPCSHCGNLIAAGERVRRQTSKFDGALMVHRWCSLCCSAMAVYEDELNSDDIELPTYELRAAAIESLKDNTP